VADRIPVGKQTSDAAEGADSAAAQYGRSNASGRTRGDVAPREQEEEGVAARQRGAEASSGYMCYGVASPSASPQAGASRVVRRGRDCDCGENLQRDRSRRSVWWAGRSSGEEKVASRPFYHKEMGVPYVRFGVEEAEVGRVSGSQ